MFTSAGLSDPFCVVRVNNAKKFKTNVAYETLAPVWNESVSIAMPQAGDKFNLVSSTLVFVSRFPRVGDTPKNMPFRIFNPYFNP